jgi:D-alanyl-D-alanine dipeptidase
MEKEGFVGLPTEWWHFDAPEWNAFALRDEPLGDPRLTSDVSARDSAALLHASRQMIVVEAPGWSATEGSLQRYVNSGGKWKRDGEAWPVSVGLKGLAWGRGAEPSPANVPQKIEGDHRAPAGVYTLGTAFGYAAESPEGVKWPYQTMGESSLCVDDPRSAFYNRIIDGRAIAKDWSTAENMKRSDVLYKWGLNVEQNFPDVKAGCGSCIFLHIWRRPGSGTEGCTAMSEENLLSLLRWLNPSTKALLVQMPSAELAPWKKRHGIQ